MPFFIIVSELVQVPKAVPELRAVRALKVAQELAVVPELVQGSVPEPVPESVAGQVVFVWSAQLRFGVTYNSSWAVPLFL